ncbi:MFS transporter [Snodgrassella sp. ESL0323]|uniref:hypothetical protein n=1 Tax=Snodgrassella sp. ESL0323 TaxID=2705034 RepID=UPI00158211D3|nr:hypothetical protein [Snodgrassella sp. ESL0323]NUF77614.1 MFS transporter [Snodgrassella sp. ESL0323]
MAAVAVSRLERGRTADAVLRRVGIIASLFFGFMFGMSGITAAVLGYVADKTSLQFIFKFCSFLPLLGILTILLPDVEQYKN